MTPNDGFGTNQHEPERDQYAVVVNHEEQYSIWPADRPLPAGWRQDGMTGTESECLAHIDRVWTDMRPLSLRLAMGEAANGAEAG
jgi:MbtH protein